MVADLVDIAKLVPIAEWVADISVGIEIEMPTISIVLIVEQISIAPQLVGVDDMIYFLV